MIRFRLASLDDVPQIAPIERAASELFRGTEMSSIADDPPIPDLVLEQAVAEQRLWVATEYGTVRAYLLANVLPESLHIEQVTVHPDAARRGIGAMLIESVSNDSRAATLGKLTLTTFSDVPWNAPYYERLGFVEVAESEWPAGVAEIVQTERNQGLWSWPRVVMARLVG
ncbi:MAG: GNAT family N-acetyltransferase [Thermomicrobiales bacterium]|nr:GNAT family N-acetyltransferase [Thermomicrobiales bacterium]